MWGRGGRSMGIEGLVARGCGVHEGRGWEGGEEMG